MSITKTLLRVTVGGLFVGHGLQKLTGSFDGPGLEGTEQMMGALDLHPARRQALAAAWTETAGGAALALGAATPVAAAGLVATMVTAVRKVHGAKGVWNTSGGFEYNAVLIAALTTFAESPGRVSLDAAVGRSRWGLGGAAFALLAGGAASYAVTALSRRAAPLAGRDTAAGE